MTSIHAGARDDRHCERESAHGGSTQEDRSAINFGCVWVQTPAACVPGECFIHCALLLGWGAGKLKKKLLGPYRLETKIRKPGEFRIPIICNVRFLSVSL